MNQYKVNLEKYVFDDVEEHHGLRIEKQVVLPFVPFIECGLGFYDHSDFTSDCYHVKRIMWNHPQEMFRVEVEEFRIKDYSDILEKFIKDLGWEVQVSVAWDKEEDALQDAEPEEEVVEVDGKFYLLNIDEVEFLKMGRRKIRCIEKKGA